MILLCTWYYYLSQKVEGIAQARNSVRVEQSHLSKVAHYMNICLTWIFQGTISLNKRVSCKHKINVAGVMMMKKNQEGFSRC